jgi:hypothetical protein
MVRGRLAGGVLGAMLEGVQLATVLDLSSVVPS